LALLRGQAALDNTWPAHNERAFLSPIEAAMPLKLVIANKAYSSWSLRPWILLAHFKIPFEEVVIPLDQPETRKRILAHAPTGKCPSLLDGPISVWESLAIIEYVAEK
jgi:glutathione S-transferase